MAKGYEMRVPRIKLRPSTLNVVESPGGLESQSCPGGNQRIMFTTFPVKPQRTPTTDIFKPRTPRTPNADVFQPRTPTSAGLRPRTPTTPVFEQSHSAFRPSSPKQTKQNHRVARIYQPTSPTFPPLQDLPPRPSTAHIQPERPAPLLSLPGLPPQELPRSVLAPAKSRRKLKFGRDLVNSGRSWLDQIRPPWANSPKETSYSPSTPKTPKTSKVADSEEIGYGFSSKIWKIPEVDGQKYTSDELPDDYVCDPPPLYKKHAPEGGLHGWMTVAGAFLIQFCTIGYLFTWNVFEDQYTHVTLTDQNPMAIRLIGGVQFFFAFLLSLVAGKLADLGFYRYPVHGGSALFSICLLLLSFVGEEQIGLTFLCQSLGMGIGVGLVFVPTTVVPLGYFKRKRGMVLGIIMSGGSLGSMIFPPVLRHISRRSGLGGAVRVTAIIVLALMIIGNALLRNPPKEPKPKIPRPRLDIAKYSKEMGYIFAAGGTFLALLILFYPVMYLDLIGVEKGVHPDVSFNMIIALSLSGIIGRAGFGFASDFVGPWNLLLPVSGFMSITLFTMCTIQGPKSLGVFAFFYGIVSGAWLSLMVIALASLASRNDELGTRVGLIFSISSIGTLVAPLLQYVMLTQNHVWVIPSAVGGVLFLVVTGLAVMSRRRIGAEKAQKTWRRLPTLVRNIPVLNKIIIV